MPRVRVVSRKSVRSRVDLGGRGRIYRPFAADGLARTSSSISVA
jgi:hypothetical protein